MADRKILIAFVLNMLFSAIEFIGGIVTGSVAIVSDSIHDLGDALSIGMAYYLEKLSRKQPDNKYTYGYMRYSVLGSVLTTIILIVGSVLIIWNSVDRIYHPVIINYDGMMAFAVIGMLINLGAAFVTHGGSSLNQKAINLHMLEDVLGWVDVMDGLFVPSISFGMPVIESIRPSTNLFFDVHLMVQEPIRYIEEFKRVGADLITIHAEACEDIEATVLKIRESGCKVGMSISPDTDVSVVEPWIKKVDMILRKYRCYGI